MNNEHRLRLCGGGFNEQDAQLVLHTDSRLFDRPLDGLFDLGESMTDEQRLQMITEQLLIVRDNLFRGMSKSIQKLQARSINEVLELENFTQSPQRTWVGLTEDEVFAVSNTMPYGDRFDFAEAIEAKLKEKNND
jgi:hypothetical protein